MPEAMAAGEAGDEWCTQRGLLDPETCSDVAKHCNDTKQAAKIVQVSPRHWPGLCRESSIACFVCAEVACKPMCSITPLRINSHQSGLKPQ